MRVELVYMQCNISEILIILEMASLDTLCVNRHFGVNSLYNIVNMASKSQFLCTEEVIIIIIIIIIITVIIIIVLMFSGTASLALFLAYC